LIYNPISIYHREDRAITLNVVSPLLLFHQMLLLGLDLTWMLVMLNKLVPLKKPTPLPLLLSILMLGKPLLVHLYIALNKHSDDLFL